MTAPTTMLRHVSNALSPIQDDEGVIVPTPVLYPSNGNVVVYVSGGQGTCVVSDRGDALRNARAHGVEIPNVERWLGQVLKGSALRHSKGGHITAGRFKLDDVFAGISLVARAATTAVEYAIQHYRPSEIGISERVNRDLIQRFGPHRVSREAVASGLSKRNYRFDFAISELGQRPLLLDTVTPNANSVNAKAIAHIDLAGLGEKAPLHAMIFDDTVGWEAADINLLESAAQLLPASQLQKALVRYEQLH